MDHAKKIVVQVKENALLARIAASFLREHKMAIVIGRTIYLHRTEAKELRNNVAWWRHELMHVWQFESIGTLTFLWKYTIESLHKGYWDNCYEVEARAAEQNEEIEKMFILKSFIGRGHENSTHERLY
jgi:hypothetical protein